MTTQATIEADEQAERPANPRAFEYWEPRSGPCDGKHPCEWVIELANDPAKLLKEIGLTGKQDWLAKMAEMALADPQQQKLNELLADSERAQRKLEAAHAAGEPEAVLRELHAELLRCDEKHEAAACELDALDMVQA